MGWLMVGEFKLKDWRLGGYSGEGVMVSHSCGAGILDADGKTMPEIIDLIEQHTCPVAKTPQERIQFEKDWDKRFEERKNA